MLLRLSALEECKLSTSTTEVIVAIFKKVRSMKTSQEMQMLFYMYWSYNQIILSSVQITTSRQNI